MPKIIGSAYMRRAIVANGGDCDKFHFPLIPSGRAFTSCRCPVAPGGGTGPTVSVLSIVGRMPPRGAGSAATDNFEMHRPSGRVSFFAPPPSETPSTKPQAPEKARNRNTKNQAPNTKEIPSSKLQTAYRASSLELLWSLELGVWDLPPLW